MIAPDFDEIKMGKCCGTFLLFSQLLPLWGYFYNAVREVDVARKLQTMFESTIQTALSTYILVSYISVLSFPFGISVFLDNSIDITFFFFAREKQKKA